MDLLQMYHQWQLRHEDCRLWHLPTPQHCFPGGHGHLVSDSPTVVQSCSGRRVESTLVRRLENRVIELRHLGDGCWQLPQSLPSLPAGLPVIGNGIPKRSEFISMGYLRPKKRMTLRILRPCSKSEVFVDK